MQPQHYHQVLGALDRTLEVFDQASGSFSTADLELRLRIARIRATVLRAESGHPFEFEGTGEPATPVVEDPDLTRVPWAPVFVSDSVQLPARFAP